jgi:TetR/AcrR family transcriptional regulator
MAEQAITAENDKPTRILAAADELFGEIGYDGVSVRDVAERAGVNKALVFYYFRSKEELFSRILAGYYGAHREAIEAAFAQEGPFGERLHRLIDAYFDFMVHNTRYPRLVQQQLTGSGSHLGVIRENLAELERWTERALAGTAPKDGPLAARHFFVTFSAAMINYFTYAPALGSVWDGDPMAPDALEERRTHLHWLVDAVVAHLA